MSNHSYAPFLFLIRIYTYGSLLIRTMNSDRLLQIQFIQIMNKHSSKVALTSTVIASMLAAGVAFADTNGQPPREDGWGGPGGGRGGMMQRAHGIFGSVQSISGTTIVVVAQRPGNDQSSTTYTVNAASAKVMKQGEEVALSRIVAGDNILVEGEVSGSSITANVIRTGVPGRGPNGRMPERPEGAGPMIQGNGQPVVGGSITSISGSTFMITNKSNASYTIDASAATVIKQHATSSVSSLAVGDSVIVQGTVNGSSVTAASVQANTPKQEQGSSQSDANTDRGRGFFSRIGGFFRGFFGFF